MRKGGAFRRPPSARAGGGTSHGIAQCRGNPALAGGVFLWNYSTNTPSEYFTPVT